MVGSRWDFGLGGLKKFLIATINQLADLAADQVAGSREEAHEIVFVFFYGSRAVVLFQKDAIGSGWRFQHVEAVLAKIIQRVFIRWFFQPVLSFLRHQLQPPRSEERRVGEACRTRLS